MRRDSGAPLLGGSLNCTVLAFPQGSYHFTATSRADDRIRFGEGAMFKTHIVGAIACSILLVSCQPTQDSGPCTDCAEKTGAVAMTIALSDAEIARVVA